MTQSGSSQVTGTGHLVRLPGTTWSIWRDVGLRSAGFPADRVLAICDESLARSADQAGADPAGSAAYDKAYEDSVVRLSAAMTATIADPTFQEALTWQNPVLAQFLLDHGVDRSRAPQSKVRKRELVVASYLQRYCLKNDTIGFFGPVGWASVVSANMDSTAGHGATGLVVLPGEQLIASRRTCFEVWAIDKIAAEAARHGRSLGWLRPRRPRSVFLAGDVLHRPRRPPVTLTSAEREMLLACDGSRTISEVVEAVGHQEGRGLLARLAELGALRLDLEGPVDLWPEKLLKDKLELISDPVARAAALAPVERMIRARDSVAAAAGDPAGLRRALAGLAETFEQVSGSPATRRGGENYAGRTLVYTDTVRDVVVELGEPVIRALAAPLGLVLDSARWLVSDIVGRYRKFFGELLDREAARAGGAPVPLLRLLTVASPDLHGYEGHQVTELASASVTELQRRWKQVLGPQSSARRHQVSAAEISAKAAELFPRCEVAWNGGRQHAPDIMIAAASPAEVDRGNFLLVLGEIHLACNTLDSAVFAAEHPERARLVAAERADRGPNRVVYIEAKDHPRVTSRGGTSAMLGAGQLYWSAALTDAMEPPASDPVMPGAAMTVERRGDQLIVRVAPGGTELDFFEVISDMLVLAVIGAFQPVAQAAHRPRITIDQFVLSREQWIFDIEESAWAFVTDEQERYRLARQWRADHELPERVFYRVPVELKPAAVDFRSLVLVNLLAKHIRQTKVAGHSKYTISEMLPDLGQLWLFDRADQRYASELRFIVCDCLTRNGG